MINAIRPERSPRLADHIDKKIWKEVSQKTGYPRKMGREGSVCAGEIPVRESLSLYTRGHSDCAPWGQGGTTDGEKRRTSDKAH